MNSKSDPWYLHAALYVVIAVLVYLLIQVAVIQPNKAMSEEKYFRGESRLRMDNLKEAEILWFKKHNRFTANMDSLISFLKSDPMVDSIKTAFDSLSRRPANPFTPLTHGEFTPDSLRKTPRSQRNYILSIDTSTVVDSVVDNAGKLIKIDSAVVIGSRYYIEDPDGYGSIGSLENDALKNTASWE